MKKILAILSAVAAILAGAVWLLEYLESSESHFGTYQQLEESGLMGKGWVPSFLPKSAYDIEERHNLDLERVKVSFRFRPGDTKEIEASCSEVETAAADMHFFRCLHGDDMVVVRLGADGTGEISSE